MGDDAARPGEAKAQPQGPPAITDTTAEFEEYTAPPRVDGQGRPVAKPKGLQAAGYQFPPPGGPAPPLTKANLAKGIGVPEVPRAMPPTKAPWTAPGMASPAAASAGAVAKPPAVKVDEGELFEEYHRPDLKDKPRTGKGIRTEPPPAPGEPGGPTAKDILAKMPEPELQVFTPKRFSPYQVQDSHEAGSHAERDQADLDAAADLAVHRAWLEAATMSNPNQGPMKAVIVHGETDSDPIPLSPPETPMDPAQPSEPSMSAAPAIEPARPTPTPYVPPRPVVMTHPAATTVPPLPVPTPSVQSSSTTATSGHASGAPPAPAGGEVPRIGLVQSDFHYDITTRMAQAAHEKARMLGATVAHHLHVPGAFDIPLAAQALLERGDVDAVVCVGAIVKGETGHDVLIARECARKLADLALALRKPVGFGVTGPDMTRDQAWARVGAGANAVESVVKQHRVLRAISA